MKKDILMKSSRQEYRDTCGIEVEILFVSEERTKRLERIAPAAKCGTGRTNVQ
jgi:hypothetical protein